MPIIINKDYANIKLGTTNLRRLYAGDTLCWELEDSPTPTGYSTEYFTTIAVSGSRLYWSGSTTANTLSYSKNDGAWSTPSSSITLNVVAGDVVRWKGVEGQMSPQITGTTNLGIGKFVHTTMSNAATFDCQGNVMSLLYGDNFSGQTSIANYPCAFATMLSGSLAREIGNVVLPATTLSERCYSNMFVNCQSATTAPQLPATTLTERCYQNMFHNCYSLTTAPELPATTIASNCYNSMFANCTSLRTAQSVLPGIITGHDGPGSSDYSCYNQMFSGCTSLITAPELPSTTLATQCYCRMFLGCTSLTTAPSILPATDLSNSCYEGMFASCTSLTTAPVISAITARTESCHNMFQGCTSLVNVSDLSITNMASNRCCESMFSGCTSLATAPALPAKTLTQGCYRYMFQGCGNLNYIKMLATDISESNCLSSWVSGVSATGIFVKDASMTSIPIDSINGIPNGWTVQTE